MKNKSFIVFSVFAIVSILTIVTLALTSPGNPHYQHRSFSRIFKKKIQQTNTRELLGLLYYFAGIDSSTIYIGNYNKVHTLVILNDQLTKEQTLQIRFNDNKRHDNMQLIVDVPNFYFIDGTIPTIYKGTLQKPFANPVLIDESPFIKGVPFSPNSFACWGMMNGKFGLLKKTIQPPTTKKFPDLLVQQTDGTLELTGMLHFDKTTNRLIYLYYYRNQFLVLDTNINLIHTGNTIDSISQTKIEVDEIAPGLRTMSIPPLAVNKQSALCQNYLYVNSGILAKNETIGNFENSSVVDVYNINNISYLFSFYIPMYNGKKMTDFKVQKNRRLYALYDNVLTRFDLPVIETD